MKASGVPQKLAIIMRVTPQSEDTLKRELHAAFTTNDN